METIKQKQSMKNILYLFALILLGCSKGSDIPSHGFRGYRAPDCGNTMGEGVFEHYNDSEAVRMLSGYINPEIEDTSYITGLSLTSHDLATGKITYHQKKPVSLGLYVQYSDTWNVTAGTTSPGNADETKEIPLRDAGPLANGYSGCYRLYYIFSTQVGAKQQIVTKGHFDISL